MYKALHMLVVPLRKKYYFQWLAVPGSLEIIGLIFSVVAAGDYIPERFPPVVFRLCSMVSVRQSVVV